MGINIFMKFVYVMEIQPHMVSQKQLLCQVKEVMKTKQLFLV